MMNACEQFIEDGSQKRNSWRKVILCMDLWPAALQNLPDLQILLERLKKSYGITGSYGSEDFTGEEGARSSIPQKYVVRIPQVHCRVDLGVRRSRGNFHPEWQGQSWGSDGVTVYFICDKVSQTQRQSNGLRYSWVECAEWEGRTEQRDAEVSQFG